jgi:hypothetical protein
MEDFQQTTFHNQLRIGHALLICGIFIFIALSLILSIVPSISVRAFGTSALDSLTNSQRSSNGLNGLNVNLKLMNAAQAKADSMVSEGYFDHTAENGTTGWDYIINAGYSYESAGENLAASNEDDEAVINGWLNSPTHRANLLNSAYTDVGYGISFAGDYQNYSNVYYIVALYASPKTTQVAQTTKPVANEHQTNSFSSDPDSSVDISTENTPHEKQDSPTADANQTKTQDQESAKTALSGTGLEQLADKQPFDDDRVSFGLLSLGTTLSVGGIAIESRRFFRLNKISRPINPKN